MTWARVLLFMHCIVASTCIGLVVFALERQAEFGWRYNRQLEVFFARPIVSGTYLACLLSCQAFPIGVAFCSAGRVPARRWFLTIAADIVLAFLQYMALVIVYPSRD